MSMHEDGGMSWGLRGIRILDFTWAGAGPYATEQLSLMGVDVVKVECRSRPDLLRVANVAYGWGAGGIESNPCFNDMNAGKRSIELDLSQPEARATALRLAQVADVVCDNMRPGKMEALGLGYETLRLLNPRLICCSVSAIGRNYSSDGAGQRDVPGYAPVFWAEGGGASVTGWPGEDPAYMRAPVDMNAATFVAVGVLAALYAREHTGVGSYVDCSAIETVAACVGDELLAASLGLAAGGLRGNDRPPFAPNNVFPCAGDDSWIALSVETEEEWLALCNTLGAVDLAQDAALRSRLGRWRERDRVQALLESHTRTWQAEELETALSEAGVSVARSSPLSELLVDPGLTERGFWQSVEHSVVGQQTIGTLAWTIDPPLQVPLRAAPLLGEHTEQILQEWLGESAAQAPRETAPVAGEEK